MTEDTTTQCWLFPELFRKPVVACFDQHRGSSDGGALLLKAVDVQLGLTARLTACLKDPRDPSKIAHELGEMLAQRVFAIACGYPDGNDAARLSDDPVHKLLVGRDPMAGQPLASQPTLSRFENSVGRADLLRLGQALAELVIERHRKRLRGKARTLTIDLDPTADPTYGEQQLCFFNGYYDTWCYLPVLGFISFDGEPEQYLFSAVLRPGNAPDKKGAVAILGRLLPRLRQAFSQARFRVRLDAGFAAPDIFDFLDAQADVDYVVAMPRNKRLLRQSAKLMRQARRLARQTAQTARLYGECHYRAARWSHPRRVIIKAEVLCYPGRELKDNPRFVVTNLKQSPQWVYEHVYCPRGEVENRIKELQNALEIDRTSCSSFLANQFRVLLTTAAYVLMQELRLRAARTSLARAQVPTLRERLLKLGAHVRVSVRRVVIHFPVAYPFLSDWSRIALAVGARAG